MRRREGDWTAAQDRELVFRYWQHLDDPTARPLKAIVVDEGRRSGHAVHNRLKKLRADPYLAALLPRTAPPCLHTLRLDIIFDPDRGNTSTAPRPPAPKIPDPAPVAEAASTPRRARNAVVYPAPQQVGDARDAPSTSVAPAAERTYVRDVRVAATTTERAPHDPPAAPAVGGLAEAATPPLSPDRAAAAPPDDDPTCGLNQSKSPQESNHRCGLHLLGLRNFKQVQQIL